jgi:hypothetical protein
MLLATQLSGSLGRADLSVLKKTTAYYRQLFQKILLSDEETVSLNDCKTW